MRSSALCILLSLGACGPAGEFSRLSPAEHFAQGCAAFEKGDLEFAAKHLARVASDERTMEELRFRASLGALQSLAQVGPVAELEPAWQRFEQEYAERITPEIYLGTAWAIMSGSDRASVPERLAVTRSVLHSGSAQFVEQREEFDRFRQDLEQFEGWLETNWRHRPPPQGITLCWTPVPPRPTAPWVELSELWLR